MKRKLILKPKVIFTSTILLKSQCRCVNTLKPEVIVIHDKLIINRYLQFIFLVSLKFMFPRFSWQILAPTTKIGAVFDKTLVNIFSYYPTHWFNFSSNIIKSFLLVNLTLFLGFFTSV